MLHNKKPLADAPAGDSPERQGSSSSPDSDPGDESEAQMRRALGLTLGAHSEPANRPPERLSMPQPSSDPLSLHRRKRRFVQEGEVPVVLMHTPRPAGAIAGPGNRLEAAEAAASAERLARERGERSLQEAQAQVRDLQTKQGHAELARREALAAAEARIAEIANLRAALAAQQEQIAAAETARAQAERAAADAEAALRGERSARKASESALREAVAARQIAEARLTALKTAAPVQALVPARNPRAESATTHRSASKSSATSKSVRRAKQPSATSVRDPQQEPVKWWVKPAQPKRRRSKTKALSRE